jgi:hypothetical protein
VFSDKVVLVDESMMNLRISSKKTVSSDAILLVIQTLTMPQDLWGNRACNRTNLKESACVAVVEINSTPTPISLSLLSLSEAGEGFAYISHHGGEVVAQKPKPMTAKMG